MDLELLLQLDAGTQVVTPVDEEAHLEAVTECAVSPHKTPPDPHVTSLEEHSRRKESWMT